MRRLIINADDLGINAQRSHGIFQCMEFGVVTSTSIIPGCSDSDTAARHAKERSYPAGLHFNITEEYPLSKADQVPSLTDANGKFHDRKKLLMLLEDNAIQKEDIEREFRAQLEWCLDVYGSPTHVDSHHHMHIHPIVAHAILPILERYGIRFVRIPVELPLPPFGYEVSEAQLQSVQELNNRAIAAKHIFASSGMSYTDHFRGLTLVGNASLKNLRHVISKLPEGTTELMVHPSSDITYGTTFDLDPQRQTELRMLLDPSIKQLLTEKKIGLCSYGDL